MALWPRRIDNGLLELCEEAGRNAQHSARLLREMLAEFPDRAPLARDLLLCEREGDRITHDIIHRLNGRATRRGGALETADFHQLARRLDDIVDYAEQTGDSLGLYGVEATMEQAVALADVLVGAAGHVAGALGALRAGAELNPHLVEVHRLENDGDRLLRDGVASLFAAGIDPMVVIRWKDIFESLEQAIDSCETVAHILEGIALRRRGR